jgi:hypothetical protein
MMSERQEELTTADLAGQPPTDPTDTARPDRIEEADLERPEDLAPEDLAPEDLAPDGDLAGGDPARDGAVGPDDLAHDDVAAEALAPKHLAPKDPASSEVEVESDPAASDLAASDPAMNRPSEPAPRELDRDLLEPEDEHPEVAAAGAGEGAGEGPTATPETPETPETPARAEVATGETAAPAEPLPLLAADDAEAFRARWTDVQFDFVNSPRRAVEQGDGLVAELMQHLARTFADERSRLEGQWDQGNDVSTEDLRTAFQRYRSFFERLLAT